MPLRVLALAAAAAVTLALPLVAEEGVGEVRHEVVIDVQGMT